MERQTLAHLNSNNEQDQQASPSSEPTKLQTHATDDEGFFHNAFTDDWLSSSIEKNPSPISIPIIYRTTKLQIPEKPNKLQHMLPMMKDISQRYY